MFARMATERKTCTCSATTSRLFCRYKPFVLPLQAVCSATISRLYCRYKRLVAHRLAKKPIARGCR